MQTKPPTDNGLVMIVDDTPGNVEILCEILAPSGYRLVTASDGESGLEQARQEPPDLMLLDMILPGMMGIDVLDILKEEQPDTTVILTTAYGSEETAIQAIRRGAYDYIINKRPFDALEVREVVRRAMSEARLRRENRRLSQELEQANKQLQEYASHLEREVQDEHSANEHLKELDRAKAAFFSMISHELRHPLTVAKGYLQLIESGQSGEVSAGSRRYLRIISENFDHLAEMIDDLLDLSRMEAGSYQIQCQVVRPLGILQNAIQAFAPIALEKDITVENRLPDSLPLVSADSMRIIQVISNLLHNAVKFTPRGGKITVSAAETESEIQVTVADSGIGIPHDELEHIFERFYQVHRDEMHAGGAGLGLAICREIVRLHGGRIWAESEPGQGSRFTFTLPRESEEDSP